MHKGRYRAGPEEWKALRATLIQRFGTCQVCEGLDCQNWPLTAHHLVGRDLGGDDVIANLALLGGTGTTKCHGLVQEFDRPACVRLRSNLTDEQRAYIIGRLGEGGLDRYYPTEGGE